MTAQQISGVPVRSRKPCCCYESARQDGMHGYADMHCTICHAPPQRKEEEKA